MPIRICSICGRDLKKHQGRRQDSVQKLMNNIKIGSLFSGIGGFECVASWYEIEPIWASEIEEAPMRIASRHFPKMKQLGDITKLDGGKIPPVDIITGGSPCQDISSAGKQTGISYKCNKCGNIIGILDYKDEKECPKCGYTLTLTRSGLFVEYIRIIEEMRNATNGNYPKFVVWENVQGCLTSNNGDDFCVVLKEFCRLLQLQMPPLRPEKWESAGEILGNHSSLAWRILDAQYWGVPQRRKRIFLVCDFRGQSAAKVCFEQESLRRHSPTCEPPWKKFTSKVRKGIDSTDAAERKSAYRIGSYESNAMKSPNPESGIYQTDISATLDTSGGNPACNQGGIAIVDDSVYVLQGNGIDRKDENGCAGKGWSKDTCYTLNTVDRPAVSYETIESAGFYRNAGASMDISYCDDGTPTIKADGSVMCLVERTVIDTNQTDSRYTIAEGACQTLRSQMGTGGNQTPLVLEEQTLYDAYQHSGYRESDTCGASTTCNMGKCLRCMQCTDKGKYWKSTQWETPLVLQRQKPVSIGNGQMCQLTYSHPDVARTLDCQDGPQLIVEDVAAVDCMNSQENPNVNGTLQAHGNGGWSVNTNNVVRVRSVVRRLTPTEAERLQGFEDGWTAGESDSARYKALGNSVALPCVEYIMSGIMDVLDPDCEYVKKVEDFG